MNAIMPAITIAPRSFEPRKESMGITVVLPEPYKRRIDSAAPVTTENRLPVEGARREPQGVAFIATEVKRLDDHIVATVARTLEWNRLVPRNHIVAESRDGHLILTGYVCTQQEREEAEMLVRRIAEVNGVDNRIEVLSPEMISGQLKSAITDVLRRHTQRICDRIGVEMKNGRVVLTGRVMSIAEKRLVIDAVRWAHHVHAVEDRIEVVRDER